MKTWLKRNYLKIMYVAPLVFLILMVGFDRMIMKMPVQAWWVYMALVISTSITRYRILMKKCPSCQKHVNLREGRMVPYEAGLCPHCQATLKPGIF